MRSVLVAVGLIVLLIPAGADDADDILGSAADLFGEDDTKGQDTAVVSGYVENSFRTFQERGDPWDWRIQDAGKLKIRVDTRSAGLRVHGEINALYYAGLTELSVGQFLPDDLAPVVAGFPQMTFDDTVDVAQAYAAVPLGPVEMTIGRQPLALGTGYAWNPVDPFSAKDSREPTYEVAAHDAVKISLPLPLNGEARAAGIIGTHATNIQDLSAVISVRINLMFDLEASFSVHHTALDDILGREYVTGLATSGQIGELGLHGEAAWVTSELERDHPRALLGGDYTFDFQNKILLEGLFDGRGVTGDYTEEDWLTLASGEVPVLGRVYLFASSSQTVLDIAEIELSTVANLNDLSTILLPAVLVNFSEVVELRLSGLIPLGGDSEEFGVYPATVELRATAHF